MASGEAALKANTHWTSNPHFKLFHFFKIPMRQSNHNLFSNTAMVGNCHDEGYLVKVSILCHLAETS
jgi:hypothetical protein